MHTISISTPSDHSISLPERLPQDQRRLLFLLCFGPWCRELVLPPRPMFCGSSTARRSPRLPTPVRRTCAITQGAVARPCLLACHLCDAPNVSTQEGVMK